MSFDFLENLKLTKKFNYFVNCQYWSLAKNCEIFIEQCDGEFIKLGKKCNLFGNLTQHSQQYIDLKSKSLLFTALDLARQPSKKHKIEADINFISSWQKNIQYQLLITKTAAKVLTIVCSFSVQYLMKKPVCQ